MSNNGHLCDGPARVYAHSGDDRTRIPIINEGITTRITTDGPTDISRYTEVHFPAVGPEGTEYAKAFKPIEATREVAQDGVPVSEIGRNPPPTMGEVQIRDPDTEEYVTVHRGVLTGVGGSSGTSNEMRLQIRDPNVFLELGASFSVNYGEGAISTALSKIATAISENNSVFDTIPVKATVPGDDRVADPTTGLLIDPAEFFTNLDKLGSGSRSFTANRDTIGDAVRWVRDKTDVDIKVWFEPHITDSGTRTVALTIGVDPHRRYTSQGVKSEDLSARDDSSEKNRQGVNTDSDSPFGNARTRRLFKNDALFEISPVNAVFARGSDAYEIVEVAGHSIRMGDGNPGAGTGDYPYALVQHDPTVARADDRVTHTVSVTGNTVTETENQARTQLERMIEGSGRGTMYAELDPTIRPYDLYRAVPVCGPEVPDVTGLNYQVVGVVHTVGAPRSYNSTDDVKQPHTQLKVRQDVRKETFSVVDRGTKEVADSDSGNTSLPDFIPDVAIDVADAIPDPGSLF